MTSGLAKNDPRSALMEALGGMDFEEGEDYVPSRPSVWCQNFQKDFRETFVKNREKIEETLYDNTPSDASDMMITMRTTITHQPSMDCSIESLRHDESGGIRTRQDDLDQLGEDIPYLKDDNNVLGLIKSLYDEVGQSELSRQDV